MTTIDIDVRGTPVPQGSIRAHVTGHGKVAMRYAPAVYAWRAQVQQAVAEVPHSFIITGAVKVRLGFDLQRPAGHYGSGRNAGVVKGSAPSFPTVMPDLDKLVRCVLDAITDAGLWKDDAQVVTIHAGKRYVDNTPGVHICVTPLEDG